MASFPLLPEDGSGILGECVNTVLLCFHPLPTCLLWVRSSAGEILAPVGPACTGAMGTAWLSLC